MTSKPELPGLPENGDEPDREPPPREKGAEKSVEKSPLGRAGRLAIELEVNKQRSIGWVLFGSVLAVLMLWKLGTVAHWAAYGLILYVAWHLYLLSQMLMHAPGTIIVTRDSVELPRGLCMSNPKKLTPKDVTAVYFLRRSVPWNKSAPVLVVELGDEAIAFPREWFASEADQRQVLNALLPTATPAS
ncbi:MAG TPA: hypothetical protein VGM88_28355 [Kofleriaceae bacterium]|jgi:hypothetical protein